MKSRRHSNGIVLIEAVVSMMILALGFLGVAKMQTAVVSASANAKARAEAMMIAQARMDTLRYITQQGQHFSTVGGCTGGTVLQSSAAPIVRNGVNASYTESWVVTAVCVPSPRHSVVVTVAWTDERNADQTVTLNGVIAWNDPAKNVASPPPGGAGSGGFGTPSNVRVGDNTPKDSLGTPNGKDGSGIFYNTATKEYELRVAMQGGPYRTALYSNVPIVRVTGIVALDTTTVGNTNYTVNLSRLRLSNIAVYRTDITFCIFPLQFTEENNPLTYGMRNANDTTGGALSDPDDRAAAYTCYVPEGWAGNIGLLNYEVSNSNPENYACPDDQQNNSYVEAARSHKVEIVDGTGVIGQSGVLTGHETMLMPGYPGLTRLSRLDFLVIKRPNGQFGGCAERIGNTTGVVATGANTNGATYNILMRTGAPLSRATSPVTPGIPSIRYSGYIVDRYTEGLDGGFKTISGSVGNCGISIRAVTSAATFICPVNGSTYTCQVSHNSSGNIGRWDTATSQFTAGLSYQNVVTNLTNQNLTCN
ncbi:hypothetical protein [Aquabacterium sp. A08]|uniref:hypothetical protein n=1 Tax=Aquabacterium sp. A08 TaxID=2718532 RepID=UPI00141E4BF6|nr:hypothetical protein [Aquabacterium sp. A08]NIC41503.1 hypothetical protein [Aquabacterium sp. A08]